MSEKQSARVRSQGRWLGVEPYWYIIVALLVVTAVLYASHLITGFTPDRAAIRIPALEFEIYWYGIWIVGGIALGAYVVSRLALAQGRRQFAAQVPAAVRRLPVADLDVPDEIHQILQKRRLDTLGDLLLSWGFNPANLGLNEQGLAVVREELLAHPVVAEAWVDDAPWRIWNPEHVWNGIGWSLILGLIGARLYHVLTPSPSMASVGIYSPLDYFRNPYQLINLRNGGLGIYGGIAGGALGLLIYTRRQRLPTLAWTDLAAIGTALGQVFGRWGNFFNQELYGRPTDLPWAVTIDPLYRLPNFSEFSRFHPAFLYESLWNLLTFLVLYILWQRYRRRLLPGDLMALYLVFYGIGRSLLELVRLDSRMLTIGGLQLNMAVATAVSLVLAVLMIIWMVWRHRRAR